MRVRVRVRLSSHQRHGAAGLLAHAQVEEPLPVHHVEQEDGEPVASKKKVKDCLLGQRGPSGWLAELGPRLGQPGPEPARSLRSGHAGRGLWWPALHMRGARDGEEQREQINDPRGDDAAQPTLVEGSYTREKKASRSEMASHFSSVPSCSSVPISISMAPISRCELPSLVASIAG